MRRYLSDRMEQVLGNVREGDSLSGRINSVADRYSELITRARRTVLPQFDRAEMEVLLTIALVWDSRKLTAAQALGAIADQVLEMTVRDTAGKTDHTALLRKLAALSPVEEMALVEWLENDTYRSSNQEPSEV